MTKRVSLWQCVYSMGLRRPPVQPLNTATILKPLLPNPHSIPFTHVADWVAVAPFPSSELSPQILPYSDFTSPSSFPSLGARELGTYHW